MHLRDSQVLYAEADIGAIFQNVGIQLLDGGPVVDVEND
jgi:hypothetical protein